MLLGPVCRMRVPAQVAGATESMSYPPLRRGRKSQRDEMRDSITVQRAYAMAMDAGPRRDAALARLDMQSAAIPPKRNRIRRPVDGKPVQPLEKHVLAACLDALRIDKRVAVVWRMQSGVFQEGDRFIRVGSRGLPDIVFMLVGGRMGACEVKRPGQKPDERQMQVLENLRRNGAIAGWATSAEECLGLLE